MVVGAGKAMMQGGIGGVGMGMGISGNTPAAALQKDGRKNSRMVNM
jgi:hypothetical protein